MSSLAGRAEELNEEGRARLEAAHRRLREAVAAYEPFIGREVSPDDELRVHDAALMAAAQRELESAEDELWRLREGLLGWARPPWTPSASLMADWFSDEDAIYDNVVTQPAQ